MNRQIIYSILSVLLSSFLFAQDTTFYFNKVYRHYENYTTPRPTFVKNNYIYSFGYGLLNNETSYFYLQRTDLKGMNMEFHNLEENNVGIGITYGNCGLYTNDDNCIMAGYKEQTNGMYDWYVYLIKSDLNGNILWTKSHLKEAQQSLTEGMIQTSDNGYLVFGDIDGDSDDIDAFALKVDSLGEYEWHQTYNLQNGNVSKFYSAQELPDGNFIFGGTSYNNQNGIFYGNPIITKIKKNGDLIWMKTYGDGRDGYFRIYLIDEQTYFAYGSKVIDGQDTQTGYRGLAYFVKTDSAGIVLQESTYQNGYSFAVQSELILLPNDEFVVSGSYWEKQYIPERGLIFKANFDGEIIWEKIITTDEEYQHYFRDVDQTPDGGFVATGFYFKFSSFILDRKI